MLSRSLLFITIAICLCATACFGREAPKQIGDHCWKITERDDCGQKSGLACMDDVCAECFDDTDCLGGRVCLPVQVTMAAGGNSTLQLCEDNGSFRLDARDWGCTAIIFFGAMLAAAGGMGGGGIFVPAFVLVAGFDLTRAVPLSTAVIMGGSIVNCGSYLLKRHPFADRPLIDFGTVLMLEPMMLAGTVLGVLLNAVFPAWVLVALLLIFLILATARTAFKAKAEWDSETKAAGHSINAPTNTDEMGKVEKSEIVGLLGQEPEVEAIAPAEAAKILDKMLSRERGLSFPLIALGALTWAVVLVTSLLKGRKGAPSLIGVKACSPAFWALVIGNFPLMILLTWIVGRTLVKKEISKRQIGYPFVKGDVRWSFFNTIYYPALSMFAGLMGGMLGLGGGMVMGPLLLELGMHPATTAATTAVTVFITSSSAAVQFMLMGMMVMKFAAWYTAVGLVATWLGQTLTHSVVHKLGRHSVIVIGIAGMMLVAAGMMGAVGVIRIFDDVTNHHHMGFRSMC